MRGRRPRKGIQVIQIQNKGWVGSAWFDESQHFCNAKIFQVLAIKIGLLPIPYLAILVKSLANISWSQNNLGPSFLGLPTFWQGQMRHQTKHAHTSVKTLHIN